MAEQRSKPWLPFDYELHLPKGVAIQAMAEGRATEQQQILAMKTIVEDICGYYNLSFSPDSDRDTTFAEGKRYVAAQIVKLTRVNYNEVKEKRDG